MNGSQFDESFDHLLCYHGIEKGGWKAINHMGEMEALKKRWKFLKELLGDFAALIIKQRPPELYKGKGIRESGRVIKLKEIKKG